MERIKHIIKKILLLVLPDSKKLIYIAYLPKLKKFINKYDNQNANLMFNNRFLLYEHINNITNDSEIIYLEFGVFKGESLKYWSSLNNNPSSLFFGFDTFTGLPEDWENFSPCIQKGIFDTHGRTPLIEDQRVKCIKGLFQDSLPEFISNKVFDNQLIVILK